MPDATGYAICHLCDLVWYSTTFMSSSARIENCHCGCELEVVTTEPFGPGPLYVPAAWTAFEGRTESA